MMQAGDSELKQELGRLVDIDVWEAAKLTTAEKLKAARQASLQLERELTVRQSMLSRIESEVRPACLVQTAIFDLAPCCNKSEVTLRDLGAHNHPEHG